jgi:hypothetical protein
LGTEAKKTCERIMPVTDAAPATPHQRMPLKFMPGRQRKGIREALVRNISASAMIEETLFVACDETSSIERLLLKGNRFDSHRSFELADFFKLPNGARGEMDIEGLAVDGGYLWVVGSHSLKRDKPEPGKQDRESALKELTDIKCDGNRYFFGRIPLQPDGSMGYELVSQGEQGKDLLSAACIQMNGRGSNLLRALRKDEHLGLFTNIPSKENGLDIEGLALFQDRAFLGLRGPVLRGWAIVLQLKLKPTQKGHLKLRRWKDTGQRYAKHFLDLDGLGIRDLLLDGGDLLILAGPTMDLDGPAAIYRWRDAVQAKECSITRREELELVLHLPCGAGADHPESMVLWKDNKHAPLLVVYDSPSPERVRAKHVVDADLFRLKS